MHSILFLLFIFKYTSSFVYLYIAYFVRPNAFMIQTYYIQSRYFNYLFDDYRDTL